MTITAISNQRETQAAAALQSVTGAAERPSHPAHAPVARRAGRDRDRDQIEISTEGAARARLDPSGGAPQALRSEPVSQAAGAAKNPNELSQEEKQQVAELKKRDREVRAHEEAHLAALGGEGGSANYTYEVGPDGQRYAVEGEVPISIGEVPGDTRATIEKARRIARAAVAPAQPSAADQRARAQAQQVEAKARQKLAEEQKPGGAEESESATAAPEAAESAAAGPAPVDHEHEEGKPCPICAAKKAEAGSTTGATSPEVEQAAAEVEQAAATADLGKIVEAAAGLI